jgi:hypothetical protein
MKKLTSLCIGFDTKTFDLQKVKLLKMSTAFGHLCFGLTYWRLTISPRMMLVSVTFTL